MKKKKIYIYIYTWLHVKYPLFLSDFMKRVVSMPFFEKDSNIKFHESRSGGAELFHADGRTDLTKLKVAFRYFAKVPKKKLLYQDIKRLLFHLRWNFYIIHYFQRSKSDFLTYCTLTTLSISWSRKFLENLTVTQPLNKFSAFYKIRRLTL